MNQKSLYERLGGYEGISAIVEEFMSRLIGDPQLGRFWQNRGDNLSVPCSAEFVGGALAAIFLDLVSVAAEASPTQHIKPLKQWQ